MLMKNIQSAWIFPREKPLNLCDIAITNHRHLETSTPHCTKRAESRRRRRHHGMRRRKESAKCK